MLSVGWGKQRTGKSKNCTAFPLAREERKWLRPRRRPRRRRRPSELGKIRRHALPGCPLGREKQRGSSGGLLHVITAARCLSKATRPAPYAGAIHLCVVPGTGAAGATPGWPRACHLWPQAQKGPVRWVRPVLFCCVGRPRRGHPGRQRPKAPRNALPVAREVVKRGSRLSARMTISRAVTATPSCGRSLLRYLCVRWGFSPCSGVHVVEIRRSESKLLAEWVRGPPSQGTPGLSRPGWWETAKR